MMPAKTLRTFTAMVVSTLIATMALTGCSDSDSDSGSDASGNSGEVTKVRIGFAGATLAPAAGLYTSIPEALGFFEDENLEIEVVRVEGTGPALAAIAAGQLDIAVVSGEPVMQAAIDGQPLVIPYVLSQRGIALTSVLEDSKIKGFDDLDGKTIGLPNLASGGLQATQAAIAEAGGDPDSVTFVAVGTGAQAANALMSGQVDAVTDTDSSIPLYELAGAELRQLESPLTDELVASISAATSRSFMEENPAIVEGWARAVAKATTWAIDHPEEAVDLHYEVYPDERPPGDQAETDELSLKQLEARLESVTPADDANYGEVDDAKWKTIIEILAEYGTISKVVPASTFYDGSLIEKINDFDRDEVASIKAP